MSLPAQEGVGNDPRTWSSIEVVEPLQHRAPRERQLEELRRDREHVALALRAVHRGDGELQLAGQHARLRVLEVHGQVPHALPGLHRQLLQASDGREVDDELAVGRREAHRAEVNRGAERAQEMGAEAHEELQERLAVGLPGPRAEEEGVLRLPDLHDVQPCAEVLAPPRAAALRHEGEVRHGRAHHLRVLRLPDGGGDDRVLPNVVEHLPCQRVGRAALGVQEPALPDDLLDVRGAVVRHLCGLVLAEQGAELVPQAPRPAAGQLRAASAALPQAVRLPVREDVLPEPGPLRGAHPPERHELVALQHLQGHGARPPHREVLVLREPLQGRPEDEPQRGAGQPLQQHQLVLHGRGPERAAGVLPAML
mmetsp:Transcript_69440/g.194733  ORF Transcript_69440/g.194733 Transcript_69440/m.194733 type:complete len:367 (+) Transcript_69440:225-1325(+)